MIEAMSDRNSLLYPHVFDHFLYDKINKKKFLLQEQSVDKKWYHWVSDEGNTEIKIKIFSERCICSMYMWKNSN